MTVTPATISCVVVTYRTPTDLLARCLGSVVAASKAAGVSLELVLVQNDGATWRIPDEMEHLVKRITPCQNLGFGRAVNAGVLQSSGNYVLLMNPDGALEPQAIELLLRSAELEMDPNWLTNAAILTPTGPQLANFLWWSPISGFFRRLLWRRKIHQMLASASPVPVERLCGHALFALRDTLLRLGPFDERYFLYSEDVDLSLRALSLGYRLRVLPTARALHTPTSSTAGDSAISSRGRVDGHLRLASIHRSYGRSLLCRAEFILIGAARYAFPRLRKSAYAQLAEVRRWGLGRIADPLDPTGWDS